MEVQDLELVDLILEYYTRFYGYGRLGETNFNVTEFCYS